MASTCSCPRHTSRNIWVRVQLSQGSIQFVKRSGISDPWSLCELKSSLLCLGSRRNISRLARWLRSDQNLGVLRQTRLWRWLGLVEHCYQSYQTRLWRCRLHASLLRFFNELLPSLLSSSWKLLQQPLCSALAWSTSWIESNLRPLCASRIAWSPSKPSIPNFRLVVWRLLPVNRLY